MLDLSYSNFENVKFITKGKSNVLYINKFVLLDIRNAGVIFSQLLNIYQKVDIKFLYFSTSQVLNDIDFDSRLAIQNICIK